MLSTQTSNDVLLMFNKLSSLSARIDDLKNAQQSIVEEQKLLAEMLVPIVSEIEENTSRLAALGVEDERFEKWKHLYNFFIENDAYTVEAFKKRSISSIHSSLKDKFSFEFSRSTLEKAINRWIDWRGKRKIKK